MYKIIKPTNMCRAYQTKEERVQYIKAQDAKRLATKIECACGGKTDKKNKSKHENTQQHQKYLQTINNITYNITNLTINN